MLFQPMRFEMGHEEVKFVTSFSNFAAHLPGWRNW